MPLRKKRKKGITKEIDIKAKQPESKTRHEKMRQHKNNFVRFEGETGDEKKTSRTVVGITIAQHTKQSFAN